MDHLARQKHLKKGQSQEAMFQISSKDKASLDKSSEVSKSVVGFESNLLDVGKDRPRNKKKSIMLLPSASRIGFKLNEPKEKIINPIKKEDEDADMEKVKTQTALKEGPDTDPPQEDQSVIVFKKSALFKFHERQAIYDKRSLFMFNATCFFRKGVMWLVDWRFFEYFIISTIILNSLVLMIYDYNDRDSLTLRNRVLGKVYSFMDLDIAGLVSTVIFTVECVLKIIAYGFIVHKRAYLRSGWNLIDFVVVVTGIIEMFPISSLSLKSLRVLRVLRPLRSINAIPSMKKNVNALISAIPDFINVVIFLAFIFILFAIFGISQYSGIFYNACRFNKEPEFPGIWLRDETITRVCTSSGSGMFTCPNQMYCGNPIEHGVSLESDGVFNNPNIFYGINGFDNLGQALLTVFQIISTDDWNYFLVAMMDSDIPALGFFYCALMIILGTFFLMNLILAVIIQAFIKIQKNEIDQELRKLELDNQKLLEQEMGTKLDQKQLSASPQSISPKISITPLDNGNKLRTISEQEESKGENTEAAAQQTTNFDQVASRLNPFKKTESITNIKSAKIVGLKPCLNKNTTFQRAVNNSLTKTAVDESQNTSNLDDSTVQILEKQSPTRTHGLQNQSQSFLTPEQESLDLSFLKQITMKKRVINIMSNQLKTSQTIRNRAQSISEEDIKSVSDQSAINQSDNSAPESKAKNPFAEMLEQIQNLKKEQGISDDDKSDSSSSNMIGRAFVQYLDKKRQEQMTKDQYFDELFQEAKQTYSDNNQRRRSSTMRQLNTIRLGLRLKRKANDFSKEYSKLKADFRAEKKLIYKWCLAIARNKFFTAFMTFCIICNTIALSLDRYPIDTREQDILEAINIVFTAVFWIEMIIKMIGFGFKSYFKDPFNTFDCIIVLSSIIDLSMTYLAINTSGNALTAFRAFRLLRIFMLAKSWKQLQNLLRTIAKTLKDVSTFSILLFLFVFCYSLLGMELFAYQAKFDNQGLLNLETGHVPESNFNMFLNAFTTVFIVLTGDEWTKIYFDHYRSSGGVASTIYFISLIIIGQKILLNLFLAILLENFDEDSLDQELKEKFKEMNTDDKEAKLTFIERAFIWIKSQIVIFFNLESNQPSVSFNQRKSVAMNPSLNKTIKVGSTISNPSFDDQSTNKSSSINKRRKSILKPSKTLSQIDNNVFLEGKSLWMFTMDNKMRQKFFDLVTNPKFDYFILVAIAVSSVHLAFENPLNDPNGSLQKVLEIIDVVTTVVFCVECLMKIITFGFVLNGRTSYLRNPWNMLDFIIIVLSIISLTPLPSELRIIKILRVIRPLRLISRNKGLKVAVLSLVQAIPNIINVSVITLLFFLIFGIVGISYFKGRFYSCNTQSVNLPDKIDIHSKWDCMNIGGLWINKAFSFDNIFSGIQTLFQMATTTGWSTIMYTANSATDIDLELKENINQYWSIFFIVFIIIGSFFLLNLFVGVVISNFNREKDKIGGNNLLTDRQKEWIDIRLQVINSKPLRKLKPPANCFRRICFLIQDHRYFDSIILICIILNTIVLTLRWYGQQDEITEATDALNLLFTAIFALEAFIKIVAIDKLYFKDSWNIFDFIVVIGSIISIFLTILTSLNLGASTTIIRAFRILRVMRLVKRAESLRLVFHTFIVTLPALVNVGGLLLLLLYLYSVLGVYLFAEVKRNGMMNDTINYESFANAFITLFIITTGDSWDLIVEATTKGHTPLYQCIEFPSYDDYITNNESTQGCGPYYSALFFYYSFILLVNLIFLNLFIAIILQGFEDTQRKENRMFNNDILQHFRKVWSDFDPEATTFIPIPELKPFLFKLGAPLGWDSTFDGSKMKQDKYIISLNLPTYNDFSHYQFLDVLDALSLRLLVKESFEKKKKEEDHLYSEENQPQGELQHSLTQQEEDFKIKMIQDINKLKFQEDAQNIEAVQNVQKKESTIETSQQNLKKDYLTSLHLAAADVTFNHMKFVVAKRKLMRKIQEVEVNNEESKSPNHIRQNQPLITQLKKRRESKEPITLNVQMQESSDRNRNKRDSHLSSNKSSQRQEIVFTPYRSLSLSSLDNTQQIDRMIEEELNLPQINRQLANQVEEVKQQINLRPPEPQLSPQQTQQQRQRRRTSNQRRRSELFGASMGGTGEQVMISEEEQESQAQIDIVEDPATFRMPLRAANKEIQHQASDIQMIIQEELQRFLNIPKNQKYLDMLERAEDEVQQENIRNDLAKNPEFMDEISKVIDEMVNQQNSPEVHTMLRNQQRSLNWSDQQIIEEEEKEAERL